MKREEAIQQLNVEKDSLRRLVVDCGLIELKSKFEAISMAIEALQTKADWIPCSKGLPNVGEDVLTTDIYGDVDIETLTEVPRSDDVIWEDEDGFYTDFEDIIAWMPKPKPYKGGKKEEK